MTSSKTLVMYKRLYVSEQDLSLASAFARYLLKKGWTFEPWERRWTVYVQQAAYTTAFVTTYARPFTRSVGWPQLPKRLVRLTDLERKLHTQLLSLRHQVYAHSDSARHEISPFGLDGFPSAIQRSPALKLSKVQLERALAMIDKLKAAIDERLRQLLPMVDELAN